MLTPFPIQQFPGLNLRDDPGEVGLAGAIDGRNFDTDGTRVRSRDGLVAASGAVSGVSISERRIIMPMVWSGSDYMVAVGTAAGTAQLSKITPGGTITSAGTWSATAIGGIARIGTPTSERVYVSSTGAAAGITLRKYDGTTLSTSSGKPAFLAVTPYSTRLVQARYFAAADTPSGANGSVHTVFFSSPLDPDTYGADDYVQLDPGDGDAIVGMVAWNEQLYVFKHNAMFVFSSESTDATGGAIFYRRRVSLPSPLMYTGRTDCPVVAGLDGVYFLAADGVYRTTGAAPVKISGVLDPLFDGTWTYTGGFGDAISWADGRLYVNMTTGSADYRQFVWDSRLNAWLHWSVPSASNFVQWAPGVAQQTYTLSAGELRYLTPTATTDDGTTITWSYQSGFYDMGYPGQEKHTRWSRVVGSGSLTVDVYEDYATSDPLSRGSTVTLGTAPAVDEDCHHSSYCATLFSHRFSGTTAASVYRLIHDIRGVRPPGMRAG